MYKINNIAPVLLVYYFPRIPTVVFHKRLHLKVQAWCQLSTGKLIFPFLNQTEKNMSSILMHFRELWMQADNTDNICDHDHDMIIRKKQMYKQGEKTSIFRFRQLSYLHIMKLLSFIFYKSVSVCVSCLCLSARILGVAGCDACSLHLC